MTRFFMKKFLWLLAIVAVPGWAQVGALTEAQVKALAPLYCGQCLELREVAAWRFTGPLTLHDATEADLSNGSILVTKPETLVKASHVCLGTRQAARIGLQSSQPPSIAPNAGRPPRHPANFETVCAGDLVRIDAFLQSVVASIFDAKLASFEALLSPDALQKVVEANLAAAMASQRTSIAELVRNDVLADLRNSPVPDTRPAPDGAGSLLRMCNVTTGCKAGASPTIACCACTYEEPGSQRFSQFKGECVQTSQGWAVKSRQAGQPK